MKIERTFSFHPAVFGIIPLLNVLFLVLVFYEMGSRFILQPGVQVSMPSTFYALGPQQNVQIVSITASPAPAIYYRDQKITLAGLLKRLEEVQSAERTLIVRSDKDAPVGMRDEIVNESMRRGYSVIIAGKVAP